MRFSRIKDNIIAMFPQLGRIALETLRADELYQAERDLMGAELNAEHWIAQRDMLKARVARLNGENVAKTVRVESATGLTAFGRE